MAETLMVGLLVGPSCCHSFTVEYAMFIVYIYFIRSSDIRVY